MNRRYDRREFLRGYARWGMFGGLAAMGVLLAVRRQTCSRAGVCAGCRL